MHANPFDGLTVEDVYAGLTEGTFGPRWPDPDLQRGYTGTNQVDLLRRSFSFVDILAEDGAFDGDWKGLDYGCGWGRFASVLLSKGSPEQFDLCDAWQVTLDHIGKLGFTNKIFKVPSLLVDGSIPEATYSMMLSFSVFTHLSPKSFDENLPRLIDGLRPAGKLYITVRHDEFFDHKYPDRSDEFREVLANDGIVFIDSGGDMNNEKLFGDTIIEPGYLERYGSVRYLGTPHTLQHIYVFDR